MKYLLKGFFLGISLVFANKLCCYISNSYMPEIVMLFSGIIFFVITTVFLISKNLSGLFLCGFCGLFIMFWGEIVLFSYAFPKFEYGNYWLVSYVGGFWGSMASIVVSIFLTLKQFTLSYFFKEDKSMSVYTEKNLKIKLLLYSIISAPSFSYLIMPENAGISVLLFSLIQFFCLWFIVPDRKRLILFIPILIMSLNCFISANNIWRIPNFFVNIVLYSCMFIKFSFKNDSLHYFSEIAEKIFLPLSYFNLPFKWVLEINSNKAPIIKRIALALIIAIPCALLLTMTLSSADMVFSLKTQTLLSDIFRQLSFNTIFIFICGIVAGLYLFSVQYNAHTSYFPKKYSSNVRKGDLIIINILLTVILFIYTLFVIIQFKYLFSGSTLPDGLTYTDYARKGFFELISLTGINIAAILTVIKFTKHCTGKWLIFTKVLCHYLCAVTIILLVSSFYRMMLYTNDDGLTRLRFFVLCFLFFEALGLIITFAYIAKPQFNITLIYLIIALTYYTMLNIIPTDRIIAKNQINKLLNGERIDIAYVYTLSADAAPAMEILYNSTDDEGIKKDIHKFLQHKTTSDIPQRWQRYNLSLKNSCEILQNIK